MKKIFTFLLFSVIAAIGAHAQDVNIPDSIFKSILVGNPDINTNQDQEIQVSEAHAYQYTIDVSNSGIYDLTGIEEFTSMFQLKCGGNHLDSLNVSGLTALSSLECSSNQLVSLNLSGLTGLQKLSCFNNQLASLNASGLTSLSSLECTNNQLVSLNVSGNTALSFLFCANNQLASLNLTGLTALKYLYCPANELTSLSVLDNTALTTLSCYRNRLASLDVSGLTNLRTLNCVLNQLASLNLKNGHNGSIWSMDCTSNSPLTCIQVDNVSNANANTNWQKDAGAKYRTDCGPCSPSGSDTSATACKSFTWHGVTYYTTGNKTFTIPNVIGCDSVVTLHLTIRASSTVSVTDAGCFGSATGSITVTPNGSAPFSYRIGTGNFVQGDSSYKFDNLKAGTYKTYVQDSTGCIGVAAGGWS